ncbi:hypothetical protein [Rhizosphaericola mali]|uniref:Uncharacterized protein n=1 Tax=Rhizosphaericola mali TaxID=2545455 RepID=A0A5P2G105_9BACT|nr:hypothetical protein [Rhizosphaericola mali]QES88867.1 hypothetical protein E0W69_009435 [Rhizosphaericola mali]
MNQGIEIVAIASSVLPIKQIHSTIEYHAEQKKHDPFEREKEYSIGYVEPINYQYFPLPLNYINGKRLPKRKNN